jgi:hypothetical protein
VLDVLPVFAGYLVFPEAFRFLFYFRIGYWQTSWTSTLLKGLAFVSRKAMLIPSPPDAEKVCVVSRQLELFPFVVTEQDSEVAVWFL